MRDEPASLARRMRPFLNPRLLLVQAFLGAVIIGTNGAWSTGWVVFYGVFSLALDVILTLRFDRHRRGHSQSRGG